MLINNDLFQLNILMEKCEFDITNFGINTHLFLTSSCTVDIPTAKTTASALYASLPQTTSEMHPVSSLMKKSVTLLPSKYSQPLALKESSHGVKITSLVVPRHQTKSKSFYNHQKKTVIVWIQGEPQEQETLVSNGTEIRSLSFNFFSFLFQNYSKFIPLRWYDLGDLRFKL